MTDRRLLRTNGRVAHVSLEGEVEAELFTEGLWQQINVQSAAILKTPQGPREREVITGDRFCVLDRQGPFVFGFSGRDGYVGWMFGEILRDAREVTHRVSVARSFRKETPDVKAWEPVFPLSYGARLEVIEEAGSWARILLQDEPNAEGFKEYVVPSAHITPLDDVATDPVAEAGKLIGTPYLWGGNSSFGIDCSGLVQAAFSACGTDVPPDSDLQMAAGAPVTGDLAPGDLMFWKGHVAMVADAERIIHANAYHMAVAYEGREAAVSRIKAQDDGEVLAVRRMG